MSANNDCLLPGEGRRALSTRVSLRILSLGDSPPGHEISHHGTLFELVFNRVRMVQTCQFEKFLKVLIQLPRLALEITLGARDILLVGALCFLFIVVVAGSSCHPLGVPFLPLL
jgi:hypothetical protein